MDENPMQDDLLGDLAAAVRKSWSESQHTVKKQTGTSAYLADSGHSPISTPVPEGFDEASIHSFHEMNSPSDMASMHSNNSSDPAFKKPYAINTMTAPTPRHGAAHGDHSVHQHHSHSHDHHHHGSSQEPDYQLFKHHYSISDDHRDSVVEILNDLELESPEPQVLGSVPENKVSNRDRGASISKQNTTTRRGSIQDVQWIRQLLNPRSSFSGNSANEPPVHYGRGTTNPHETSPYSTLPDSKCWVTILVDDSIEAVKSIIVLSESMRLVQSAYPLYVIHDHKINMSRLRNYNISSIPVSLDDFTGTTGSPVEHKRLILSLFVNLVNAFDLVCYIAPTCMVVENIDELLSSSEICNEIDNETCVLLTNVSVGDNEPQLMVLKPNHEVSMCIKEYFTIYGDDHDGKIERLSQMDDLDILRELFHDTWGQISSEGYVSILQHDVPVDQGHAFTKIADFKYLQPWTNKIPAGDNTYCGRWYRIWNEFCAHVG